MSVYSSIQFAKKKGDTLELILIIRNKIQNVMSMFLAYVKFYVWNKFLRHNKSKNSIIIADFGLAQWQ